MYKEQKLVINELRDLFEINDNRENGSYEIDGSFGISKKQMERFEVVNKLQKYFNGVGVKDGYVSVGSITLIHTTFKVCDGKPS